MARAVGAKVFTTAGSNEKVQLCRQIGANVAINYKTGDVEAALKKFGPIDVWWETLREQDFESGRRAHGHAWPDHSHGRPRIAPALPIGTFYTKDCSLHGFAMFNAPPEEQRKCAAEINRWMARGRLKPIIGKTMPLAQAAAAHRLQEENTLRHAGTLAGKIVLTV